MKNSIFLNLLFALLFTSYIGCTPKQDNKVLTAARNHLIECPDSTMLLLREMNIRDLNSENDKAQYALLYSLAKDKCYVPHENDSLVKIAVDYFSRNGTWHEKAESYYISGRVFSDMDSVNQAVNSYLKALDNVDKSGDMILKGLIYYHFGNLYQKQRNFEMSDNYINKSIELFGAVGDSVKMAYSIDALARTYNLKGEHEESIKIYEDALRVFEKLNDNKSLLNTASSIASVYYQDLGDPEKAISELTRIYDEYNEGLIPFDHYALLSFINFRAGNYDEAVRLLNEYLDKIEDDDHYKIAPTKFLLSQYHAATGNYKQAYTVLQDFIKSFEQIHAGERDNLVLEVHKKYEKEQLQERLTNVQRISNLQLIIVVLVLLIAVIIIMRIVSNRRHAIEEKNKNIEELESYIESLNSDIKQLDDLKSRLSSSLSEKNEKERKLKDVLNKKVEHTEKLLKMASQYSGSPEVFMDKLKKNILTDSRKEYFGDMQEVVNDKFHGIIGYLQKEYPDLNNDDLNLCCLVCFEFSINQQTLLFGHNNSHSIYTNRNKLRKKLGLPTGEGALEAFMENLKKYLEEAGE